MSGDLHQLGARSASRDFWHGRAELVEQFGRVAAEGGAIVSPRQWESDWMVKIPSLPGWAPAHGVYLNRRVVDAAPALFARWQEIGGYVIKHVAFFAPRAREQVGGLAPPGADAHARGPARNHHSARALAWLRERPDEAVSTRQIADGIGAPRESLYTALRRLSLRRGLGVVRLDTQLWRYEPALNGDARRHGAGARGERA